MLDKKRVHLYKKKREGREGDPTHGIHAWRLETRILLFCILVDLYFPGERSPSTDLLSVQSFLIFESPLEVVSKVVLMALGDSVMEWFNKPIVQQFLLNEIPSQADILMHKLNVMFPSSSPELRSMLPPKPLMSSKWF
ncbi:hypothetical protein F2Q70_00011892 [Brassica cretica]|uniref:Uncharacterized protein n=1 Tax=Brassica cretica TaxID=69181 RepID=A0A8S9M1H3_BRACR|nr:hypothetical protein F2Q70_00011892 [Brassica cretica]